jgi:hypothetical protein
MSGAKRPEKPPTLCSLCNDLGYTLEGEHQIGRILDFADPCTCRAGGQFVEWRAEMLRPDPPVIDARQRLRRMNVTKMPERTGLSPFTGPEAA